MPFRFQVTLKNKSITLLSASTSCHKGENIQKIFDKVFENFCSIENDFFSIYIYRSHLYPFDTSALEMSNSINVSNSFRFVFFCVHAYCVLLDIVQILSLNISFSVTEICKHQLNLNSEKRDVKAYMCGIDYDASCD